MDQFLAKNHHYAACKRGKSKADHLINFSNNKLLAEDSDPVIHGINTFNAPYVKNWNDNYVLWKAALNYQMYTTADLNQQKELLAKTKAVDWELAIWAVYHPGSAKTLALIPHGRQAFNSGTIDSRIHGIETLISNIGSDAALADVKTDATATLADLKASNIEHGKAVKNLADQSIILDDMCLKACQAMLANEASLTKKYFETPQRVDHYFDIKAMRRPASKTNKDNGYPVELLGGELKLLDLRFVGTETWEVSNNGDHDACIFFANTGDITVIPDIKYVIPTGESLQIDLSTLPRDQRFVYAANLSPDDEGELNILLVVKK